MRFTMRFLLALLLLCVPACDGSTPVDVGSLKVDLDAGPSKDDLVAVKALKDLVAIQALIDRFDDTEVIVGTEPWYDTRPVFVDHAKAVAAFGDRAINPLIVALEDENPQVRVAAALALEIIGPAAIKAKPILEKMLQSDDDHVNILACGIIRGIGGPDAIELTELVMTLLDSENFHVQYWACRALSSIGPDAAPAVGELVVALREGVTSVRRNAAIALGNIAGELDGKSKRAVINALEQTMCDYSVPVREAAKEALNKLTINKKVA